MKKQFLLILVALATAIGSYAQHRVQVAYVIPKGQTPKPHAAAAIASVMSIVQRHFYEQLGTTFELANPLVTQVYVDQTPEEMTDWNTHMNLVRTRFAQEYLNDRNVVVSIIEGSEGAAGGSLNTVKMTGSFWEGIYNAYVDEPYHLATKATVFSHELGHAFGLMHTEDTKNCLAKYGVNLGALPSLVMQMKEDRGSIFNYPFLNEEKRLLLDPNYFPACRPFLGDGDDARPHASNHLNRNWLAPTPAVTSRNVNYFNVGRIGASANSTPIGAYQQRGPRTWVEISEGRVIYTFRELKRDAASVYVTDDSRRIFLRFALDTNRVLYKGSPSAQEFDLYAIRDAMAPVNGWLANYVAFTNAIGYAAGAFVNVGGTAWEEQSVPEGQRRFSFTEVGRDDWSIYLEDRSRNVAIQLDLHTKKVMYRVIGQTAYQIYTITFADNIATDKRRMVLAN